MSYKTQKNIISILEYNISNEDTLLQIGLNIFCVSFEDMFYLEDITGMKPVN